MSKRTFKIVASDVGFVSPTKQYFRGKYPMKVARKFGTRLFKLYDKRKITVLMRETTRGSEKLIYKYLLEFKKFKTPAIRVIYKGTPEEVIIETLGEVVVHKLDDNDPKVKKLYKQLKQ